MKIKTETGQLVADRVVVADSFRTRLLGRMFSPPLQRGEGLLLRPCGSVHTFFCRGEMDVVFLDRQDRVLAVAPRVPPRQMRAARGAIAVLELAAGTAEGLAAGAHIVTEV